MATSLPTLKLPIYLDHAATTPCDPRVVEAMLPYFTEAFGNPGSRNHQFGWDAEEGVDKAREQVAALIGADEKEIIFTSGSTEATTSRSRARRDVREAPAGSGKPRGHIISVPHRAQGRARSVQASPEGRALTSRSSTPRDGMRHRRHGQGALRDDTILVTLMWANNEIGTINEIREIGALCHERGVHLPHRRDAVGRQDAHRRREGQRGPPEPLSGHKIYGPKGVGALYVRRRKPRVRLVRSVDGGGQERGFRSGTLNVPGIVGLGKACEIAMQGDGKGRERLAGLRRAARDAITSQLDSDCAVNGHREKRLPHIANISFGFVEGESLMMASRRSRAHQRLACTSASLEPSYVLKGLGVGDELAHSSLRLSLGGGPPRKKWTTRGQGRSSRVRRLRGC
jgi:cysteine desulfurase